MSDLLDDLFIRRDEDEDDARRKRLVEYAAEIASGGLSVVEGAQLQCNQGSTPSVLITSISPSTKVCGARVATILDHRPGVNILPFGVCAKTGQPCTPVTPIPWIGIPSINFTSAPTLSLFSVLRCQNQGVITVRDTGQDKVSVGKGIVQKMLENLGVEGYCYLEDLIRDAQKLKPQPMSVPPKSEHLTHEEAMRMLQEHGIHVHSSKGPGGIGPDPIHDTTSLQGVRRTTIDGIIAIKAASGCDITVTGGTEHTGKHTPMIYSHQTGYKLDISFNDCIKRYIEKEVNRERKWKSPDVVTVNGENVHYSSYRVFKDSEDAKVRFFIESDHWDVLFIP